MNLAVDPTVTPDTYPVPVAAVKVGCSPSHYYELFKRGEVPGIRLGRRIVVPKLQLERYLNGEEWV